MSEKLHKFMQLTKVDVAKKRVYGTFTAEVVDKSGEIADYETTKKAMQSWSAELEKASGGKSLGNIRKMHGKEVVGKAVEINYDDENKIISGVVEANDQTIEEASKGFLNGFSIGGSYAKKWSDPVHKNAKRFTPVISEISMVDNPCVPDAVFNMIKDATFAVIAADGSEVMQKFAPKEEDEAVEKTADDLAEEAAAPVLAALAKVSGEVSTPEQLAKAMYHVSQLSNIVDSLSDLAHSHERAKGEGHPVTAKLKKHVKGLSDTLHGMAGDEADNMKDAHDTSKAAGIANLKKPDIEALRKACGNEELLKDFTPAEEEAVVKNDGLQKAEAERDALKKVLADLPKQIEEKFSGLNKQIDTLQKQVKHLESQPAPDNAVLKTVLRDGQEDEPEKKPVPAMRPASPADFITSFNR